MEKSNPCFGCKVIRQGSEIKSPCCHDVSLVVDQEEYLRLFLPLFLRGRIGVDEIFDHENGEMFYSIQVYGACYYLSIETGECDIQDEKPEACKNAKVGHFKTCVR